MLKLIRYAMLLVASLSANASAASDIHRELEDIASRLATKIEETKRTNVAVADFTDLRGAVSQLGRFVSEEVSTNLVLSGRGFSVIDRNHLRTILKEQKLSMSGLMDPENQKKLGKILGVDALILGSITPFGESYRITFKVVATDTARVVAADRGNLPKTPATDELWGTLVSEDAPGETTVVTEASSPMQASEVERPVVLPQPKKGEYRNQYLSLIIESVSIRQDKQNLNLVARLTNVTKHDIYLAAGVLHVVDDAGVSWRVVRPGLVGVPSYPHGTENFNQFAGKVHHNAPDSFLSLMTPGQSQPVSVSFSPAGEPGEAKVLYFSAELYLKVPVNEKDAKEKWRYSHVGIGISGIQLK